MALNMLDFIAGLPVVISEIKTVSVKSYSNCPGAMGKKTMM